MTNQSRSATRQLNNKDVGFQEVSKEWSPTRKLAQNSRRCYAALGTYWYSCKKRKSKWRLSHRLISMDSGLEAFSHYPTDGSFAALSDQTTAFTNYLNQQFLSYYVGLLSQQRMLINFISRIKLTCLATV